MQQQLASVTLADIVAKDYQAAAILERHGLDFCCGGRVSLADACRERGLKLDAIIADLSGLDAIPPEPSSDVHELISQIVDRHHGYVREAIPAIQAHLTKVVAAHGSRHPELAAISGHFNLVADELMLHLAKEEQLLFPYIRSLAAASRAGAVAPPDIFGTVQNPIRMMEGEHRNAGNGLGAIRSLASGYQAPADACATYRLVYAELDAFERDLHRHVHLENNILFPRAIEIEAQMERKGRIGCEARR